MLWHGAPDYGFAEYAHAWIPDDEENNRKLARPLLASAVLYFSPPKETCRKAVRQDRAGKAEDASLVLAGIAVGDMAGEPYEGCGCYGKYDPQIFPDAYRTMPLVSPKAHITDDTVLSAAVMDAATAIKKDVEKKKISVENIACVCRYERLLQDYAKQYPDAGYGGAFYRWAVNGERNAGYKSYGNGGAMRVGVIGALFGTVDDVICQAVMSALPTHSHPEGIKGAVVTAVAVFLALHGVDKKDILQYMSSYYQDKDLDGEPYRIRTDTDLDRMAKEKLLYTYVSVRAQETVPEAIINLRYSDSYESCIRNVFRYACDSDTVGAISGGIAAALYPEELRKVCRGIQSCNGVYQALAEEILDEFLN